LDVGKRNGKDCKSGWNGLFVPDVTVYIGAVGAEKRSLKGRFRS
jgi:hypothetical protein